MPPCSFSRVRARIPLDVDLEDRLLYGLTPARLAYLVVALLAGFSAWSTHWAPAPPRAAAAVITVLVGAAAAWGRWKGRALDNWAIDLVAFCISNYGLRWHWPGWPRLR